MAYTWMATEDPLTTETTDVAKIQQRYSLATMYFALAGEMPSFASDDECAWPTVACGTMNATLVAGSPDWQVTELNMAQQSFTGTIPPEVGLLAPSLRQLDIAENPELTGSIPEEVYDLGYLKHMYLHQNAMTGTISEKLGNLLLLEALYLGNNGFTGSIPQGLGSLRWLRKSLVACILRQPNSFLSTHTYYRCNVQAILSSITTRLMEPFLKVYF